MQPTVRILLFGLGGLFAVCVLDRVELHGIRAQRDKAIELNDTLIHRWFTADDEARKWRYNCDTLRREVAMYEEMIDYLLRQEDALDTLTRRP